MTNDPIQTLLADHLGRIAPEISIGEIDRSADLRDEFDRHALERADDQSTARAGDDVLGFLSCLVETVEHGTRVAQDGPTHGSERDRLGTAGAIEDRRTDGHLEGRDLLADGRLGVAEDVGRSAEGALVGHGHERLQVAHQGNSHPLF